MRTTQEYDVARRPLPLVLRSGAAPIIRRREPTGSAAVLAPVVPVPLLPAPLRMLARGLRRLAASARRGWSDTPRERRGALVFFVGSVVLTVALLPYGVPLALVTLAAVALWQGRGLPREVPPALDEAGERRLGALYEALVPCFHVPDDPDPLYAHGGAWQGAFACHARDADGRLCRLVLRYPAYFADDDADARARVERVVAAKSGRGREYRFDWDEEAGELTVTALSPLPTDIAARQYRPAPGETVLGFTDPADVPWTLPVVDDAEPPDLPAVVWRTGPRCTEPHLLAAGRPGSGTSTLLRTLARQALDHGDVLIVDGSGTGEHAGLKGRAGVLAVESGLTGALAALEWAAHETRRRLVTADRARQAGHRPPEDTARPLWLLVDRPALLADLAAAEGRQDPQELLRTLLRLGSAAGVTVVVAEHVDALDGLDEAVWRYARARVVLGAAPLDRLEAVLGAPPHTTPTAHVPPGRGYARLGSGPVLRLQVPAAPDPSDEAAGTADRAAAPALLSKRVGDPAAEPERGRSGTPAGSQPNVSA